tara:strand:+ start:430 stop:891 length:462 start_codon:yes stop_codon:yes gene_type:complete
MNPEELDSEWTIDLSEVEATKKKKADAFNEDPKRYCIPDGEYAVRVTNVNKEESKAGNPMFVWDFEVCDGPHTGHSMRVYTAMTPAALWKLSETVESLGLGENGQAVKFTKQKALGRRALAQVEAEEYNKKWNSKIQKLFPHPDGPIMDDIPF